MKLFTENFKHKHVVSVFHGSESNIDKFDIDKSEKWNKFALWFSDDKDLTELFGSNIYEVSIGYNNVFGISGEKWDSIRDNHAKNDEYFANYKKELIDSGYDCLKITYKPTMFGGFEMKGQTIYAIFSNESILSSKKI